MSVNSIGKQVRPLFRALEPFAIFIVFSLILFSLSRFMLVVWQFPRVAATDGLNYIMFQGLRFDLVMLGIVLVLPLLLTPLAMINERLGGLWNRLILIYLVACFALFVFIEAATPSFINQYDLRPNIWFIEYLKYPDEVFSTLYKAYKLQLLLAIALTVGTSFYLYRKLKKSLAGSPPLKWYVAIASVPIIFLLCVAVVRSTLDHRPVNPSTVAFSNDPLVNTLPLSSSYTVFYAAYQQKDEQTDLRPYGDMAKTDVIDEIKRSMKLDNNQFVSEALPTLHKHQPSLVLEKKKNLVIILVESLGAEFVGKLGGLPLTPNIDKLSEQGLWFNNLYATGTRSVRGIEAVISGYLPTAAPSVVKQPKSQSDFFTIASALKEQGYSTSFIYGGEGQFDNMASFFSGNGFEKIIDQDDYVNPVFYGSWGVPDEDLFNKANEEFAIAHDKGPFFSLVFTASNHSPYDFPEGRIALYEQPQATRNNAVKYTDFAIGQFIEKAKQSKYWDDTLFLIIADHNSRVFGSNLVPIEGFHIPALVLGKDVEAKTISRVASQVDMLPTLLSLMGVEAEIPTIGLDLTRKDVDSIPGRAIMQFADNQAYMEGDNVVILSPGLKPRHFKYINSQLQAADAVNVPLEKKALAHSIWPTMAYHDHLYKTHDNKI
ncbi:MAG TPA: LTA synthase family protein [Gammaproteobacteria bacterium]